MSRWILVLTVIFGLGSLSAAQTVSVWVDAVNGNDGFSGSESLPFSTINRALDHTKLASGATIRIHTGTYDWAHEDTYTGSLGTPRDPFPLVIDRNDLVLEGAEIDIEDFPQVGGGVSGSAAEALILLDATAASRENITLTGLWLVGDNVSGQDSPVALLVDAEAGHEVKDTVVFSHNVCKRPALNDSGEDGLATLTIRARDATVKMIVEYNEIEASERGGIEILAVAGEDESVNTRMSIRRNRIEVPDGQSSLFGVRWGAAGADSAHGSFVGLFALDGNTLSSGWFPGDTELDGFVTGVEFLCPEFTNFGHMQSFAANTITGCRGDGMLLSADGGTFETGTPNITILDFWRNRIVNNGGSGLVLEWDATEDDDGSGYIFPTLQSNLIAGNGGYGILLVGIGAGSKGNVPVINATIADNGLAGYGFESMVTGSNAADSDDIGQLFGSQHNNIVYFNNADGDQVTGLGTLMSAFMAQFHRSNLQQSTNVTLPSGQGNIDADPLFVSRIGRDWHIDTGSPCIDAGHAGSFVTVSKDIDDDDRVQDSDYPCEGIVRPIVDIGADEVPQPECD